MSFGRQNLPKRTSILGRADGKGKPVTSIYDVGNEKRPPSSSVFDDRRDVKSSVFSRPTDLTTSVNRPRQEGAQTEADDLRYSYVRKLIKARQAKEQRDAAQKGMVIDKEGKMVSTKIPGKLEMHLGTGATFHRGLRGGLDKTMKKMFRQHKYTMRNISATDRQLLGDIIAKHAANRGTGVGYGWADKKRMKNEVQQLYNAKKISKVDMGDFKKIIEQLE